MQWLQTDDIDGDVGIGAENDGQAVTTDIDIDIRDSNGESITSGETEVTVDPEAAAQSADSIISSERDMFLAMMALIALNGFVPVGALEFYIRPKGFGGQGFYQAAWYYIAYGHFTFFATPLIAVGSYLVGGDGSLGTLVWYLKTLSIPELSALGVIGALLIRIAIWTYDDNTEVSKKDIEWLEYIYASTIVVTIILVESFREGAVVYAEELQVEAEKKREEIAAAAEDPNKSIEDAVPVDTDDVSTDVASNFTL